jgi:hypothetical protein
MQSDIDSTFSEPLPKRKKFVPLFPTFMKSANASDTPTQTVQPTDAFKKAEQPNDKKPLQPDDVFEKPVRKAPAFHPINRTASAIFATRADHSSDNDSGGMLDKVSQS